MRFFIFDWWKWNFKVIEGHVDATTRSP